MWCRMTQYNVWLQCDVGWHNTMFDYNVMWDDTIQCLITMWCRMTQYNVWLQCDVGWHNTTLDYNVM